MKEKKLFLSHSGSDKKSALEISNRIEASLSFPNQPDLIIFNTSNHQFRFKEIKDYLSPGANIQIEYSKWRDELSRYLKNNLLNSDVYLLLVTNRSLLENSDWILFEMEIAKEEALKGSLFFYPCLYGGASFDQLPEIANEFQCVDLNSDIGFFELVRDLKRFFQRYSNK